MVYFVEMTFSDELFSDGNPLPPKYLGLALYNGDIVRQKRCLVDSNHGVSPPLQAEKNHVYLFY